MLIAHRQAPRLLVGRELRALEPVEGEQAAGRQLRPHRRHAHQIGAARASRDRARRASPRADSRAPRARARAISLAISLVSITPSMRRWIANSQSSCCRSASTADCMSGYCSLAASGLPSSETARCTCPSEAAAAGLCSNSANFSCQPAPSSAIMRRFTKAQPIGGASLCSFCSSSTYSGGSRSGTVAISCATFMIGPFSPPSAAARSERCGHGRARARQPGAANFAATDRHWRRRGHSAPRGPRSGFSRDRACGQRSGTAVNSQSGRRAVSVACEDEGLGAVAASVARRAATRDIGATAADCHPSSPSR